MNQLTQVFKALSDRNRLRVVTVLLIYKEICACQIQKLLKVTGATASRHMGVLISSGLVSSRKEGRWVYYSLKRQDQYFKVLIDWIQSQIKGDPIVVNDAKSLTKIISSDSKDMCHDNN